MIVVARIALWTLKRGTDRGSDPLATAQSLLQLLIGAEPSEPSEPPSEPPTQRPPGHVPGERGITVPEGTAPDDLSDAIRRYFPESEWQNAARVSWHESSHWYRLAERNTLDQAGGLCGVVIGRLPNGDVYYSEQSIGYFQINRCSHGHDREYWRDADNNVRKAAELWHESRWRPWYETGKLLHLV